ncbi:MAG: phosphohistidine phosphatase SixA [Phycisphaerales bacterium]|nr:MAG: phosphohistidine phosphatase SixA [Phycisphaerales bacterium]
MKLYLVQHAKAAGSDVDPDRSLTEQGRRELQRVVDFVKPLDLSVDYIWHSGKTRAAQTADVLSRVVRVRHAVTVRQGLSPNDDVSHLAGELAVLKVDVMIVGHMPFVARLASLLLTGRDSALPVAVKNAGIVCLGRLDPERWQLEWAVTPEVIREE